MGPFSSDGKYSGRNSHRFSVTYHMESVMSEPRRYVDDANITGSSGGNRNVVGGHVNCLQPGDGSPVGGDVPYF